MYDHVSWIKSVLKSKPHLNQSGLAKHLGRHRSVVTMMLQGQREIKARELAAIEAYLGERFQSAQPDQPAAFAPVIGTIGPAWYEAGTGPVAAERRVAPSLDHSGQRQTAYVLDAPATELHAPAGAVILATPIDRGHRPTSGQIVICRRERAGLENLTLGRVQGSDVVPIMGGEPGTPVAIAIEIRLPLP